MAIPTSAPTPLLLATIVSDHATCALLGWLHILPLAESTVLAAHFCYCPAGEQSNNSFLKKPNNNQIDYILIVDSWRKNKSLFKLQM